MHSCLSSGRSCWKPRRSVLLLQRALQSASGQQLGSFTSLEASTRRTQTSGRRCQKRELRHNTGNGRKPFSGPWILQTLPTLETIGCVKLEGADSVHS